MDVWCWVGLGFIYVLYYNITMVKHTNKIRTKTFTLTEIKWKFLTDRVRRKNERKISHFIRYKFERTNDIGQQ